MLYQCLITPGLNGAKVEYHENLAFEKAGEIQ